MSFQEAIAVVIDSAVLDMQSLAAVCGLNRDLKQKVQALFESRDLQRSDVANSLNLHKQQLKSNAEMVPAAYLLLHAKEEFRKQIVRHFSAEQVQDLIATGDIKAVTQQAFGNDVAAQDYRQALDRCHVSCFTPVGIFCMLYEISKVLDHLKGEAGVDISLAEELVEERGALAFVNNPTVGGVVAGTASVGKAPFPREWLEVSHHKSGHILRSIPRWFIEDPRHVYLFALDKFQNELANLIDQLKAPTGKLNNFATTDLCLSILGSPIGLALYRDTDHITFLELYGVGQKPGVLPLIRKLVFSFPGFILVRTAGPKLFADIILHCPNGLNAYVAAGDFPTAAKSLRHLMRYRRDQEPLIEFYKIHPRFCRTLLLAADRVAQLSEEHLNALCSQLGVWSAGDASTHVWLPHDLVVDGLLTAANSTNDAESIKAAHVPELLRALDVRRPTVFDDRGARAIMGLMLLQHPSCDASAVNFVRSASIVAVALVAFVEENKAAAIEEATRDGRAFILRSTTEHAAAIQDLLDSRDSLLNNVVIQSVDPQTGATSSNIPGISVADLLRTLSSEDGRKLQNDGVLDVSDPQQINEVSAFLANRVLAQGLSEKVWDANFLVKLRITPTAALLEGLKKELMPKSDVLALPRTVFGTFDELHDAISEGFFTASGDSYESMLAQLARYREDEMTAEQIARAREKSGENETIVKLKFLFNDYEYDSVEATIAWRQLADLGMTYHDCATTPLPCFLLLLDDSVHAMLKRRGDGAFQHIVKFPTQFAQLLVDDERARAILLKPWFPLEHCQHWTRAQVDSAIYLAGQEKRAFLDAVLPDSATFEDLISLTVPTLGMLRKPQNAELIKQGAVKVAELVSVGSNKEMHLTDTLSICFKSGLIPRAVKAGDWQILLQQLRDQDVQALIRREAELFERDLLYVVDGWTAADLPFLAKLKDVDMETYNNTFELLSEGHLDQQAFRDIVSISPSWLGRGSESMYELGVLSADLIQGFHAKAPQLHSLMGYLNFTGIAVTYNHLMEAIDEVDEDEELPTLEMFLQPEFSAEIIQHLLLGRFAGPLTTGFLRYEYFVHPDKTPLEAVGRLLAKVRGIQEQQLLNLFKARGICPGHIRDYNGKDAIEACMQIWQAMAASDPQDKHFLKSGKDVLAAKKTSSTTATTAATTSAQTKPSVAPDNPFLAAVSKASAEQKSSATTKADAKPAVTSDNPFMAGMAMAAEQKASTAASADEKKAATTTFAAPAGGSKFTFQPASGQTPTTTFSFKAQGTGTQNYAAAIQRRKAREGSS